MPTQIVCISIISLVVIIEYNFLPNGTTDNVIQVLIIGVGLFLHGYREISSKDFYFCNKINTFHNIKLNQDNIIK
jgi:hypothetical protein